MAVLFRHQWLGASAYQAGLAPGVAGFGDIGSAFSGSEGYFAWGLGTDTFLDGGREFTRAECPPTDFGTASNWLVYPGSEPTTATPAITGAWSARFYHKRALVGSESRIITFREGTTNKLWVDSACYNTGTSETPWFTDRNRFRVSSPGLTSRTNALGLRTRYQRVEIQFDPDRSPSLVLRCYAEDSTTVNQSDTLDPTEADWDNFVIGPLTPASQRTEFWGDFEIHDDYDLGGQFTSNPTSPTAASTTATGVPTTNPAYPARFNIPTGSNETTAASATYNQWLDVDYTAAGTYDRKFDIYTPQGTAPTNGWPVVVWCHSGYFAEGSRKDLPSAWRNDLINAGYAVATVEYVLSGTAGEDYGDSTGGRNVGGRYPSHIVDLKRAGAYIRDNSATYNVDPNKMITSGYSAGGYLALAALVTKDVSQDSQGNYLTIAGAAGDSKPWGDGQTTMDDPAFLGAVMYNAPVDMDAAVDWDPGGPDAVPTIWIAMDAYMDSTADTVPPIPKPSAEPHTAVQNLLGLTGAHAVPTLFIRGTSDYLVHWEHVDLFETALTAIGEEDYLTVVDEPTIHKQQTYDRDVVIDYLDALTTGEGDVFEQQSPVSVAANHPSVSTSDDDGTHDAATVAVTVERAHSSGTLIIEAGESSPDGIHDVTSAISVATTSLPSTAEGTGNGPIFEQQFPIAVLALARQVNAYTNPPIIVPTTPGLGEDVYPAPSWQVKLYQPLSNSPFAMISARAKSVDINLQDPSTATFTVSGNDDTVNLIDEFVTDAIWSREGRELVRCRIGGSSDTIDHSKHDVVFSGADYRALLDRRWLTESISTTGVGNEDEQFDIAWAMINQTQNTTGGDLGITRYDTQDSGVDRADVWDVGTQIGTAITELGNRRTADGDYGYDWDVLPDLKVRFWTPTRGVQTGYVIEYGSNCDSVRRTVSSDDYANYIATQWSDKAGQEKLTTAFSEDLATRPEGRWEYWEGGSWATTGEGNAFATGLLAKMQGILPSYEVTMLPGTWDPALCWVGDIIGLVVQTGRLNVRPPTGNYRVQRISATIADDGTEQVKITLGAPAYQLATRLWNLGRSVGSLERR